MWGLIVPQHSDGAVCERSEERVCDDERRAGLQAVGVVCCGYYDEEGEEVGWCG